MFCSKCGKELKEGVGYCNYCGTEVLYNTCTGDVKISRKRFYKMIIVTEILIIIIQLIGITIFLEKNSKERQTRESLFHSVAEDFLCVGIESKDIVIQNDIENSYAFNIGVEESLTEENIMETDIINKDEDITAMREEEDILLADGEGGVVSDEYDETVSPFGLKFISENGLYGFCNVQGETVVPCIYDNIYFLNEYGETTKGIFIVERGAQKGALDVYGNVILDTIYRKIDIVDSFVYTFFSRDDKKHANLFDFYGNPVLGNDVDPSDIKVHEDVKRITARIGAYVSMFDYDGNMIFDGETIKCNGISTFRFGIAGVSTDTIYCGMFRNHYYIDSDGNILTQAYGAASEFNGLGQAIVNIGAKDYNEQTYLIDTNFNIICNLSEYGVNYRRSFRYESLSFFHNGFIQQDDKLVSLTDFQEYDYEIVEQICFWENEYSELLIVKNRLNNLYGLILDGEIIYPTQYDDYYLEREEDDTITVLYPTYSMFQLQYGNEWEDIYISEDMLIDM